MINLKALPVIGRPIGKVFTFVSVGEMIQYHGNGPRNELLVIWGTKTLRLGQGLGLSSTGFARFRSGIIGHGRHDTTQPQFWVSHPKLGHLNLGAEVQTSGPKVGLAIGGRVTY